MMKIKNQKSKLKNQKGIALIISLLVMFFLMSVALAYSFSIKLETNLVRNYMDDLQAQYCAKAGIYRALGEIKKGNNQSSSKFGYPRSDFPEDAERLERFDEIYRNVYVGEGSYSVMFKDRFGQKGLGPMDESSLIDINFLAKSQKRDELRRLFETVTDDMTIQDKLIDCLMDYVDKDDNARLNGAEKIDYEDLEPPSIIANGDMRDPSEFLVVLDMMMNKYPDEVDDTIWFGEDLNENGYLDENENDGDKTPPFDDADDELDRGIKDFVTVDSGIATVNKNTASPEVLEIMFPDDYEVILEDRQYGRLQGGTTVFRIRSYGRAHGYTHVVEWVVKVQSGKYPEVIKMHSI